MSKKILIGLLVLFCFFGLNVKAEEQVLNQDAVEEVEVDETAIEEEKEKVIDNDVLENSESEIIANDDNKDIVNENSDNVNSEIINGSLEHDETVYNNEDDNEKQENVDDEENLENKTEVVNENDTLTEEIKNQDDEKSNSEEIENIDSEKTLEIENEENLPSTEIESSVEEETNNNIDEEINEKKEESYKVTFSHHGYKLSIAGGSSILLSELNNKLGINILLSDIYEVLISNNEVLNISPINDSNDYTIKSLRSFDTEEELIIHTKSGDEYVIKVTDPVNDVPDHEKILHDNHDGTYTLELTVTGEADPVTTPQPINVLLVYDTSSSMIKYWIDGTDNKGNVGFMGTNRLDPDYETGNISNNYTGYFPLYKKVGNSYQELGAEEVYTDQLYRRGNSNGRYEPYNGERYTTTRADAAEYTVRGFVNQLYSINSNTNIAMIGFSNGVDGTKTLVNWTTNKDDIIDNLSIDGTRNSREIDDYPSGTNYEAALQQTIVELGKLGQANNSNQTFIIFITDGEPSQSVTDGNHTPNGTYSRDYYEDARDEVRQVQNYKTVASLEKSNTTFYGIYAYGRESDYLDDLVYDAYHDTSRTTITNETDFDGVEGKYFKATDTAALQSAMANIFNQISDWLGINSAVINDGTTSKVEARSNVSHLLDVDDKSFKYYKGNSTWTDAPAAELNENGEVIWNLGEEVLENGVTYRVTFDVWPSQVTLDLIADLKNGVVLYDYEEEDIIFDEETNKYYLKDENGNKTSQEVIDPVVKKYLVKSGNGYTLYTNTEAMLYFQDSREGWDENNNHSEYNVPEPVKTLASEVLAITKKWENELDEREASPITLNILMDNNEWFTLNLNSNNQFKESAAISIGIITIDENGNLRVRCPGHDYSFGELGSDVHNWEIEADIVRPMLINGVLKNLIRKGTEEPTSGTYYKIGDYYYVEGEIDENSVAQLSATNNRRSWIDITKTVSYGEDATHFDDQLFYFDVMVKDKEDKDIWFAIKESASSLADFIYEKDGLSVEGATRETKNLTPSNLLPADSINYDETTGMITYIYDGKEYSVPYAGKEGDIYKYYTGYYFTGSENTFTVGMKKGWNLRIINLLTGSTYTIKEVNIDDKFAFDKITLVESNIEEGETPYSPTINGTEVQGEIKKANDSYTYTYNNKNVNTEVKVTKVWDDGNNSNQTRPNSITLRLFQGEREYRSQTVFANSEGAWEYVFKTLPIYDANGEKYVYTVKEDRVSGYKTLEIVGSEEEGFTVTNVQLTSLTIKKVWDDASNQDGKRPTSLTVTLSNGTENVGNVVLNAANSWTATINDLPVYANGELITYTWTEGDMPEGYSLTDTSVNGKVTTLTNSYTPETTSLTVKKVWDDASNQDGKRPTSLTVTLSNGTENVGNVVLNAANSWTATINNLPVYANGELITYTWTEGDMPEGYSLTDTSVNGKVTTLTNSYTPETTSLTVKKVWSDAENQDGKRPASLIVTLSNGDEVTLNEANGWTATINDLPVYANGELITYTWTEGDMPEGYSLTDTSVNGKVTTLTNSYTPETTSLTVKKVWDDASNQDGKRPTSLTVTLSNGTENVGNVVLNAANSWTATINNLPVYANGELITYTWTEGDMPEGYSLTDTSVNGKVTTLTNSYTPETTSLTIKKVWSDAENQDGKRPSSLTVTLSNGDEVTLNEENGWTATINGLPVYANGELITYTWTEGDMPEGYSLTDTSVNGKVTTLTNSYTPETTSLTIKKVWSDAENQDGKRPTSLTVTLSNGDEVTLNEANGWTATINNLPVYANGELITYTWTEGDMPEGYSLTDTSVDGTVTTLTNTHEVEKTEINVVKVWSDDNNESGKRPENITVTLLANGKEYDTVTITEKDNWKHTFIDLPKYDDGEEIEYSIIEENVPEGYEVAYEGTMEDGFTIHNILGQGDGEPDEPTYDNPQTGDNILLYLITLLISVIGFVSGKIYTKKYND